jgi:hypothetical protein
MVFSFRSCAAGCGERMPFPQNSPNGFFVSTDNVGASQMKALVAAQP